MRLLPREEDFSAPVHDTRVAARLGLWLGVAVLLCFVTGVASHGIQAGWPWPTRPVNLYRVTQGVHVLSGIAAVPLLFAKLWSVYPILFQRPPVRSLPHAVERVALYVLIAGVFFQLATGLFNSAQAHPWRFVFVPAHYAVAWLAIGALAVHIGAKLYQIREGLAGRPDDDPGDANLSRRGLLRTAAFGAGLAVLATAGQTVPWLRRVSPLATTDGRGPQGLAVNRSAQAAGVTPVDESWRLRVQWPGGTAALSLADLAALPQRTQNLPIACVEGWSASARWTGVRLADLLRAVGASPGAVRIESLEVAGAYRTSTLPAAHVADPLTLLALRVNGEVLDLDHGYPCRIIAPTRAGVLQTKWVDRLAVLR